jgi:putative ABC transport system permease protein
MWMVGVLAVAVAVSTATWSIAYGLWIERPPFAAPDRLVSLGWTTPTAAGRTATTSAVEYLDLKNATADWTTLAGVEASSAWYLKRDDRLTTAVTAYATTNLFDVLGVTAALGRTFEPADADAVAAVARAVISHRMWRRQFQADSSIIGRTVTVSGAHEARTIEIVGVLPEGVTTPGRAGLGTAAGDAATTDLFIAMPDGRRPGGAASRRIYDRSVIARLRDAVTIGEAQDRLTPILQRIDRDYPLFSRVRRADLLSLQELWFGGSRSLLWLLAAAAAFVILVTMANAAGLMSVIASRRSREFAVRAALGANPGRLLIQSLSEMAAIALASWIAGSALAIALTSAFVSMAPQDIPRITGLHVDWRGWLFAAGITAGLCLLLGLMPAWLRRRRDVINALHGGLAFTPPRRTLIVRRTMIVVQTAVVLALLASAGLVSATLWRLLNQPLGFDPTGVVIARITPTEKYFLDRPRYQQAMEDVRREVLTAPGQREVALAFDPPLASYASKMQVRFLERDPEFVATKFVTDGFFSARRTPLLAGRDFRKSDYATGAFAIVNERFAAAYFGSVEAALGREFDFGPRHQIVGVVANVREEGVTTPLSPVLYPLLSSTLRTPGIFHVVSREARPSGEAQRIIEDAVRRADPTLHVEASSLSDRLRVQTATARTQSAVLALLAAVTLGLAMLGIYATISQMVEDRRREMAIRSTLGASSSGLVTLVMRGVAMAIGLGILGGGLLSWIVARVTRQFLFEMSPFDPFVWTLAAVLLMAAGALAAWLPARRAGLVNPIVALKDN